MHTFWSLQKDACINFINSQSLVDSIFKHVFLSYPWNPPAVCVCVSSSLDQGSDCHWHSVDKLLRHGEDAKFLCKCSMQTCGTSLSLKRLLQRKKQVGRKINSKEKLLVCMCHMTFILRTFFSKGMDKCSQESAKVCNSYIMTTDLVFESTNGWRMLKAVSQQIIYANSPFRQEMQTYTAVWNNAKRLPSSAEEPCMPIWEDKQPGHWDHVKMICRKTRNSDSHSDYTDTWPWVCKKQVYIVYCISRTLNVFHDHYNPGMEGGADFFFEDLSGLPPFSWLCIRCQTIKCKNIGDFHLKFWSESTRSAWLQNVAVEIFANLIQKARRVSRVEVQPPLWLQASHLLWSHQPRNGLAVGSVGFRAQFMII